ncbi:hypothetical protein LCGC14_1082600 [marine sediment metagenome]|uniref:Uncharacterized protein n=1 Tax=marine sediment metagenome TaxID=412755 RepID=A0A0F9PY25_9ZZZZ
MNIYLIIILTVITVSSAGILLMSAYNTLSHWKYIRAHKQYNRFRDMGLIETASIIRSGQMDILVK